MKAIIFSDWHIHQYEQHNTQKDRLANCIKVLSDICEFADRYGITTVLFAGDLYDTHKVILTEVINEVIEAFSVMEQLYPAIVFIAISGNHDQSTQNLIHSPAVTALSHLDRVFENFKLIDNTYIQLGDVYVHGVPYYKMPEHFSQALDSTLNTVHTLREAYPDSYHYLLMHQTPNGIGNSKIPYDIEPDDARFANFDYVYCGHIHTRMVLGNNFTLVGNPIHKDAADSGKVKGFLVANLHKPEKEALFMPLKGYPEFVEASMDDNEEGLNYHLPEVIALQVTPEQQKLTEEFKASLGSEALLANFWAAVDGKDKEILKLGIKLISYE